VLILGIDIGLHNFAICQVEGGKRWRKKRSIVEICRCGIGRIKTNKKIDNDVDRFGAFLNSCNNIITNYVKESNLVVIEKPFGIMGNGRVLIEILGICKYVCWLNKKRYIEIPQKTLKLFATGKGDATKSDMVLRGYKEHGIDGLSEDEVDAFWLAYLGYCIKNGYRGKEAYRKKVLEGLKK
jgi:Holliday junction resolvasome RuvABC endonuclease subunit